MIVDSLYDPSANIEVEVEDVFLSKNAFEVDTEDMLIEKAKAHRSSCNYYSDSTSDNTPFEKVDGKEMRAVWVEFGKNMFRWEFEVISFINGNATCEIHLSERDYKYVDKSMEKDKDYSQSCWELNFDFVKTDFTKIKKSIINFIINQPITDWFGKIDILSTPNTRQKYLTN